jgi:hypothetical protein
MQMAKAIVHSNGSRYIATEAWNLFGYYTIWRHLPSFAFKLSTEPPSLHTILADIPTGYRLPYDVHVYGVREGSSTGWLRKGHTLSLERRVESRMWHSLLRATMRFLFRWDILLYLVCVMY